MIGKIPETAGMGLRFGSPQKVIGCFVLIFGGGCWMNAGSKRSAEMPRDHLQQCGGLAFAHEPVDERRDIRRERADIGEKNDWDLGIHGTNIPGEFG